MLKQIIENKKVEIEISKRNNPLSNFQPKLKKSTRDFKKAISKDKLNLIAEFKIGSPSRNINEKQFEIKNIIKIYDGYADAVSVLTDNKFFSGSLDDMNKISKLTALPILRKDFIIDEYQIYESRLHNADAILLIASILDLNKINHFIGIAKSLKMDCIVEVHTEEELDMVLKSKAEIIGINNRNLDTLEMDLDTTLRLAGKIQKGMIIVGESGIKSRDYVEKIKDKVNAILVGSFFMNSGNIEKEILTLIQ
ncbi:indole-3-glycerol phosphate synthase TrpC [Candidatus Woesearchaeota archaeon]|nr:indole-3-glycerol phosphate synthase TrpC [Candidatus Woesearchaeota archaeon]